MSQPIIWLWNVDSDNPCGADNQQERPGFAQWVVGFVDGEGCFSVLFVRNSTDRLGWQVQPSFVGVQGVRSVHVLEALRLFFGCGQVGVNRRRDNHREDFPRLCVRSARDVSRRIVPFFEDNPLFTAKRRDFESFAGVVRLMCDGAHLMERGPAEIAGIVATINHGKSSRYLESSEAIRQPPRPTSR